MSGEGFNNPFANALGQIIIQALQSPNFVAGVSGWIIRKDGTAEFASIVIRGSLIVAAPTGQTISITPATVNPQITFTSADGSNNAFINSPNFGLNNIAALGLNCGVFTPGDGIPRRMRIFFSDLSGIGRMEVIRDSDQARYGGYYNFDYLTASMGYKDPTVPNDQFIKMNNAGMELDVSAFTFVSSAFTLPDINFDQGTLRLTASTPSGLVSRHLGRGVVGVNYYTGGTGMTSAGTTEAALPAWTAADSIRFVNGRVYQIDYGGGFFSSVISANEVGRIRLRSAVNSTVAQVLGTTVIETAGGGSAVASFVGRCYVKNNSGADIDKTSLGFSIARANAAVGTGNFSGFGNSTDFPLYATVTDIGRTLDTQYVNLATQIT